MTRTTKGLTSHHPPAHRGLASSGRWQAASGWHWARPSLPPTRWQHSGACARQRQGEAHLAPARFSDPCTSIQALGTSPLLSTTTPRSRSCPSRSWVASPIRPRHLLPATTQTLTAGRARHSFPTSRVPHPQRHQRPQPAPGRGVQVRDPQPLPHNIPPSSEAGGSLPPFQLPQHRSWHVPAPPSKGRGTSARPPRPAPQAPTLGSYTRPCQWLPPLSHQPTGRKKRSRGGWLGGNSVSSADGPKALPMPPAPPLLRGPAQTHIRRGCCLLGKRSWRVRHCLRCGGSKGTKKNGYVQQPSNSTSGVCMSHCESPV